MPHAITAYPTEVVEEFFRPSHSTGQRGVGPQAHILTLHVLVGTLRRPFSTMAAGDVLSTAADSASVLRRLVLLIPYFSHKRHVNETRTKPAPLSCADVLSLATPPLRLGSFSRLESRDHTTKSEFRETAQCLGRGRWQARP